MAQLSELVGEGECVKTAEFLLAGGVPIEVRERLPYFGARATPGVLEGTWKPYWARVWGARGLLYVWDTTAAPAVVRGVSDPHWRVAEMCLKVAAKRELAEAGEPSTALAGHELPRVRVAVVRTLGQVGDTEHLHYVVSALDDEDTSVRRAAELAVRRLCARLDIRLDR